MSEQRITSSQAVLEIKHLSVEARDKRGVTTSIVNDVSFSVGAGEVVALIGESGSGKTTVSLAAMGFARAGCAIASGRVVLDGTDVLSLGGSARRAMRGRDVSYIAQSAAAAFNAALRIDTQVTETPVIKGLSTRSAARDKAIALYRALGLPDPEHIGSRYPHQLSGGQLQRVMAAMAMICDPKLLILDEPTTALDVTTQVDVLRALKDLVKTRKTSAIYVSHDLAVVAQVADRIVVLRGGSIVETGSVTDIVYRPQHAYTRELIGAAHVMPTTLPTPRPFAAGNLATAEALLSVDSVTATYANTHDAVLRNVSVDAFAGRTLGVIGESGSGKTTLGRVMTGLMPLIDGGVSMSGRPLADRVQARSRSELQSIQFAFQMADVALNPRHRVGKILRRPLEFYLGLRGDAAQKRIDELLTLVELPLHYAARYPRELSGGERQRVNLARALAAEPKIIVCDEVTSALDTVVAKAILSLIEQLQARFELGVVLISHDLSVIARMADTIAVMQEGQVVDYGLTGDVLSPPLHPYTKTLLECVPELDPTWLDRL